MPFVPNSQPPAPEWSESQYLVQNDFEKLAARRIELKYQQDAIESELAELNLEIGAMLATADVKSVKFGFHRITLGYSGKGGRLSKERLVELGVPVKTIEAATTPREPGAPYVSVTEMKGAD
jgi:hypothetical protein